MHINLVEFEEPRIFWACQNNTHSYKLYFSSDALILKLSCDKDCFELGRLENYREIMSTHTSRIAASIYRKPFNHRK